MDKNSYTGFFLIVLIMIGSYFLLKPSDADVKKEKHTQDSIAQAKNNHKPAVALKTDTPKKLSRLIPLR